MYVCSLKINISIMVFVRKILICLAAFSVALTSCRNDGAKSAHDNCDEILRSFFIDGLKERLFTDPVTVIDTLKKERENTADSITSYALLYAIAHGHLWIGEFDVAVAMVKKVIDFCEREEPTPCLLQIQGKAYEEYALCMIDIRENDSANVYAHKALDLAKKTKNHDLQIKMNIALAVSHDQKSDYPISSYYYQRALFVMDSLKIKDIKSRFTIYFSLGKLYSEIENFDMAEYHFGQAEKYVDEMPESGKNLLYQFKGISYFRKKDYPTSLKYHHLYHLFTNTENAGYHSLPLNRTIAATNLADVYLQMEMTDSARYFLEQAKEYYEQSAESPAFEFYIDMLCALLALKENNLKEAEKLLLKPYNRVLIEPSHALSHYQHLEELYARNSDFKNAYKYKLIAETFNDSIRSDKIRNRIAEMEMRYQQDTTLMRKDLLIAIVEGRASRWKSVASISLFLFSLLAALAGSFIYYAKRKRELEYRRQIATVTELRMQIVRNRLSPHFVFNALNVMMPTLGQHKELEKHFSVLVHLLRNNLRASEQMAASLGEEIDLVKNYLQLQELSNPGRIKIEWQIADDVPQDTQIPSMSIQIPVENAVKYAFTSGQADAQIDICISLQTNELNIVIEDNGIGYRAGAEAFDERGTGSGLKMLHRTVDLLNLRNSAKMVFKIENRQQLAAEIHGTRVTLIVPTDYRFD